MTDLGLTLEEFKEVERTWCIVTTNSRKHGIEILMALFTRYPDYKNYFKRFDDISMEELPHTSTMKAHASSLMHGIAALIENLGDKDALLRLIHNNVERHYVRSIRTEQYKNTLNLLPGYLQQQLGSELTTDAASGWQKVIATLCDVIEEKITNLNKGEEKKAIIETFEP